MDVEARLLLYMVAIGALASIAFVVLRRARELAVHAAILGVILAGALAGLLLGAPGVAFVAPVTWAYAVFGVGPYFAMIVGRRAAVARRFGLAAWTMTAASLALGRPRHLRREAGIHRALAAFDRGDIGAGRATLESLAEIETDRDPERVRDLARLLPPFQEERWADVLLAAETAERRSATVLSLEAQAAAEAGDLRRALRVVEELAARLPAASQPVSHARAVILAASGRYEFLVEARRRGLALADLPASMMDLLNARALEAAGERDAAAAAFAAAARRLRGTRRRHALAGEERCRRGEPRRAHPDEIESIGLHDLERAALATPSDPRRRPLMRRAPATVLLCCVTAVVSLAVFAFLGEDEVALSAAGALGSTYVRTDGEWGRLATAMLLHGGLVHLALNLLSILFVGKPYEERMGSVRLVIVYIGSGLAASAASVLLAGTPIGIGASGAAMGLVGALGATALLEGHLFEREERRTWLGVVAVSIVANGLIGAIESRAIDNAAHGGGLVAGALIAWVLFPRGTSELGRRARQLVAGSLVAVVCVAAGAVAVALPTWRGTTIVGRGGATCEAPAWLRVRNDRSLGALLVRPPLPFLVQIGRTDIADSPRPASPEAILRVLAEEDSDISSEFAERSRRHRRDGDLAIEEVIVGPYRIAGAEETLDADFTGIRILTYRRDGGAFAVVVMPDGPEGEATYGATRDRIARTLRVGSGTEGGGGPGEAPGAGPSPGGRRGGR